MTGDCHVRICGSRGVRIPPATRLSSGRAFQGKERDNGTCRAVSPTLRTRCTANPSDTTA